MGCGFSAGDLRLPPASDRIVLTTANGLIQVRDGKTFEAAHADFATFEPADARHQPVIDRRWIDRSILRNHGRKEFRGGLLILEDVELGD